MIANGEEKAMAGNGRDDLLKEQAKQDSANCREVKVVHFEQKAELEGLAVPHQFSSSEDYDVV